MLEPMYNYYQNSYNQTDILNFDSCCFSEPKKRKASDEDSTEKKKKSKS